MPMYNHYLRLAVVGMLDLIYHADIHIRHKHKEVLKIGLAINVVERILPDLVLALTKLGFDNRVITTAATIVELLTRLINQADYKEI